MGAAAKNHTKPRGDPALAVREVKLAALSLSEYNPRRISEEQLGQLEKSIRRWRMVEPIVVNRRASGALVVVGGHQRVKVLARLGRARVPAVILSLRPPEEKLLNLALNKLGGEWDLSQLAAVVAELSAAEAALDAAGFSEDEVKELLARAEREARIPAEFPDVPIELEGKIRCPKCGYELSRP